MEQVSEKFNDLHLQYKKFSNEVTTTTIIIIVIIIIVKKDWCCHGEQRGPILQRPTTLRGCGTHHVYAVICPFYER